MGPDRVQSDRGLTVAEDKTEIMACLRSEEYGAVRFDVNVAGPIY